MLKVDIVSCESSAGFAHELGRTFSVRSDRVSSMRRHIYDCGQGTYDCGQGWALPAVRSCHCFYMAYQQRGSSWRVLQNTPLWIPLVLYPATCSQGLGMNAFATISKASFHLPANTQVHMVVYIAHCGLHISFLARPRNVRWKYMPGPSRHILVACRFDRLRCRQSARLSIFHCQGVWLLEPAALSPC